MNEVRLPVYLNLAACYLADGATQDLEKVVENANLALKIDASNTKALYRAGRAHLVLGDLDAAKNKLAKAAKNQPNDKNIREALQTLRGKLSEYKAKEKEAWGGRLLADASTDSEGSAPAMSTDTEAERVGNVHGGASSVVDGLRFWIIAAMVVVAAVVLGAMHISG